MKKSIKARARPVQEKNSKKPSSPNFERGKTSQVRKSVEPSTITIRPMSPNAHDPVDDELTISGLPDIVAGKYTPSEAPW